MTADLLDTPCGRDLAVATGGHPLHPRGLSRALFHSVVETHSASPVHESRAATWHGWSVSRRRAALARIDEVLADTWPDGCSQSALTAATHRHLGDLTGELCLAACRVKEDDPAFTKPMHAFWTCPVVAGSGPVGFESLIGELNPHRCYASWDVSLSADDVVVVDSAADWRALVERTGCSAEREFASPRWTVLDVDAVHVTNRAVIESFAPGETPLWDWGMEQTAWFRPRGTYERVTPTETWQEAVARLSP